MDVQCISKGKEHKLYEFGNKVSITRTGSGVIVGGLKIKVSDYFGKPEYYLVMPPEIFEALEKAFKAGEEYVNVDDELFEEMIEKFKIKRK